MPDPASSSRTKPRLGGAVLLALSIVMLKVGAVDPLAAARAHEPSISDQPLKLLVLSPCLFVLGGCLLFLPGAVWSFLASPSFRNPETKRPTPLWWAVLVLWLLPGLVLSLWVDAQLRSLRTG